MVNAGFLLEVTAAALTDKGPIRKALEEPVKVGEAPGNVYTLLVPLFPLLAVAIGIEIPLKTSVNINASVAIVVRENFKFSIRLML